jgi:hypothetical protein
MKINFNSYTLARGGGNRCILELTNSLVERGHKVTITHLKSKVDYAWFGEVKAEVINLNFPSTPARFLRKYYLRKRHYYYNEELFLQENILDCDVNVATWCMTAYPTLYSGKGRMFYLVQHYEPWFFPKDQAFVMKATLSYQLPMTKLCVSDWLTKKVGGVYIGNGVNLKKFHSFNFDKTYDVMVIPREIKWKGDYTKVVEALKIKGLKVLAVENASEEELIKSYNISKVFLFLSDNEGFGYPPLEALACGIPVVSTDCTEFLVDKENSFVLPKDYKIDDVVSRVEWLIKNRSYAESLVVEGYKTAHEFDFKNVVKRFEEAIEVKV